MKIKICGMTRTKDTRMAESLGADFIGLIFVPSSPRYVTREQAQSITGVLQRAKPVGVFVDALPDQIESMASAIGLYAVQLYAEIPRPLPGVKCIRAIRVKDHQSLCDMDSTRADYFLLDSWVESTMGGTGTSFDWSLLPGDLSRVFLSGGLNRGNARQARRLEPFAVDVCSGVEQSPGVKDPVKMRHFVEMVRG